MKLEDLDRPHGIKRSDHLKHALDVLGVPIDDSEWVFISDEDDKWQIWGATAYGLVQAVHEVERFDAAFSTVSIRELTPWTSVRSVTVETRTDHHAEEGFATTVTASVHGQHFRPATEGRGHDDRSGILGFVRACLAFQRSAPTVREA